MFKPGSLLMFLVAGTIFSTTVFADILVTVDENGNGQMDGQPLSHFIGTDPGPGGLPGVLVYSGLPTTVQGDVGLFDLDVFSFLDYIRFNGDGTLIFYSDNVDGFDALADTPTPPNAFYPNIVGISEVGPEGANGAFYTPGPTDPGAVLGTVVTYHFISDVPEPSSLLLVLTVFGVLGLCHSIRKHSI